MYDLTPPSCLYAEEKVEHEASYRLTQNLDSGSAWFFVQKSNVYVVMCYRIRDDKPGESRPRDPGESHILGPGFSPGFIDGIPGLQE